MGFFTSLNCIWFYLVYVQILPFFIIITKPFHSVDFQRFMTYCMCNVLQVKQRISSDAQLIEQGYILANHRSWTDFVFDTMISRGTIIGRREAFWAMGFSACLGYLDKRIISFTRGAETRQELFSRIRQHMDITKYKRILFFPEGTRLKYTQLRSADDVKTYLKYGMLKCIYEDKQFPVQLQISNNKELVLDEKRMHIQYGMPINTHRSKPIYPNDYATEQLFYDEIAAVWYECWKITHLSQDAQ
jgi:hypothetical protein